MEFELITQAITTLGFPIACCGALGFYIKKRDEQYAQDRKNEREALLDEIKFNREVNSELLATNRILAGDIKNELSDIKEEIQKIQK